MTDDLNDFLGFLDDDAITLPPIPSTKYPREDGGHRYRVEQPNADDGQKIAALGQIMAKQAAREAGRSDVEVTEREVARLRLDDDEERDFQAMTLGDTLEQMRADGVNHNGIKIASNYAFVAFAFSEAQALKMAEQGLLTGKAVPSEAPSNRAARRGATSGNPAKRARKTQAATTSRARSSSARSQD